MCTRLVYIVKVIVIIYFLVMKGFALLIQYYVFTVLLDHDFFYRFEIIMNFLVL
jgi:hypothetical protein